MLKESKHLPLRCAHTVSCCAILVLCFALFGVAITVQYHLSPYDNFLHYYGKIVTSCIIFGIPVSIAVGLWGCIAGHKDAKHLTAFAIVLGLVLGAHIAVILVHNYYTKSVAWKNIERSFEIAMTNYWNNREAIDYVQKNLECCGWNTPEDWFDYGLHIPASCCPKNNESLICYETDIFTMYHEGCGFKLPNVPQQSETILTILFVVLQVCQISTLLLSCWICWRILRDVCTIHIIQITNT